MTFGRLYYSTVFCQYRFSWLCSSWANFSKKGWSQNWSIAIPTSLTLIFGERLKLPSRHHPPANFGISSCRGILHWVTVTFLVLCKSTHVIDVIWIEPTFTVIFLIRELTFLKMAEKPFVWHDMVGNEGALYSPYSFALWHSNIITNSNDLESITP